MNKYYPKQFSTVLTIAIVCLLSLIIVNSCKRDNAIDNGVKVDPITLSQAKQWYEAKYAKTSNGSLTTQGVDNTDGFDLSQLITPDWLRANGYERFNKQVLEIPVTDSAKLLAGMNLGIAHADPKLSRSSFLIVNDNGKYTAFVMMIIADSAYLKNDLSKLAKNTYNKHEADFSGEVFYFSAKGKLLSGYLYKDGAVKKRFSMGASASQQKIQSINSAPVKLLGCTHWFADVYVGGTFVETLDLGIACDNEPLPPILMEDGAEGFPQPPYGYDVGGGGGGSGDSVPTVITEVIDTAISDSLKKHFPCAKKMIIDSLMKIQRFTDLIAPFKTPVKPNLTYQDSIMDWNKPIGNNILSTKYGVTKTGIYFAGSPQSAIVTLNSNMLTNSSMLLIAAVSIHETLHAVINSAVVQAGYNIDNGESWMLGLNAFYINKGLPTNFGDHYEMMTFYFNIAINILSTYDSGAHTQKEYAMAMMVGINNPGADNGSDPLYAQHKALLQKEYDDLKTL